MATHERVKSEMATFTSHTEVIAPARVFCTSHISCLRVITLDGPVPGITHPSFGRLLKFVIALSIQILLFEIISILSTLAGCNGSKTM
jgi:hypothetical protein